MLKLDEWGKDYHPFLREVAKFFATTPYLYADDSSDFNELFTDEKLYPPIEKWLGYYLNSKALLPAAFKKTLAVQPDSSPIHEEVVNMFKEASLENQLSADDLAKKMGTDDPDVISLLDDRLHDSGNGPAGSSEMLHEEDSENLLIDGPESLFLLKVFIPCLIWHYDFPAFIYRNARNGHIDSICRLLQLDARIIADNRIADAIHKASLDRNSKDFKKILKAQSGKMSFTSIKKMKMHLAGIVYWFFGLCEIQLKAPEIQELFDAAYIHYHPGEMMDPDLPDMPHTFYMAIRNRNPFRLPKVYPQ